ncbi:MAG: flagellar protein FlgN [Syntrophales bacterium]|jgi:flagellar biosynthesis/type III secretory pathway chaperone
MDLHTDLYPLIDSLIGLLKREIVVYRELQATIAQEKIILLKPSLERLLESNSKKETVILKAKMLEEGRLKLVKKIANMLDLDENDVNLTVLCSHADPDQQTDLRECQSTLNRLLTDSRKMNQSNKDLLDYSLHFLQGSIDFIHSLLSSASACYMPSGKIRPTARNGKLVQTEG